MLKKETPFRVCMAQMNSTVGDIIGNTAKIIGFIKKAEESKADIVSFPEMAISGYPPEDLLLKKDFIESNRKHLEKIVSFTANKLRPIVIVGFIEERVKNNKKVLYNSAAVIQNGKIIDTYQKTLLPNYSVFDEKRYFSSGNGVKLFHVEGIVFGISICEDIWEEGEMSKVLSAYNCPKLLININASPFHRKKWKERENILKERALESASFITYTNMFGGQDELVFDGHSMIVNPQGDVVARGKAFEEDFICKLPANWENKNTLDLSLKKPPENEAEEIYNALVLGIKDYCHKNGFLKVLVGLSGGIDSAITLSIAVDALGHDKVQPVFMPSRFTSEESTEDAVKTAENMGTSLITIPIQNIFEDYMGKLGNVFSDSSWDITEENLQARIRGNLLMALSNKWGHLVLTTGNKSETSVGYATLYGDMAGGFAAIKDLLKTWVYRVSEDINTQKGKAWIPERVLEKEPSAELKEDQKDSDSLPPYSILDVILEHYVENDMPINNIIEKGFDRDTVIRITKMVDRTEYKRRQAPIGIKITPKAFGRDRRLPVTNRFLFGN